MNCPICKSEVRVKDERGFCVSCKRSYRVIGTVDPLLVSQERVADYSEELGGESCPVCQESLIMRNINGKKLQYCQECKKGFKNGKEDEEINKDYFFCVSCEEKLSENPDQDGDYFAEYGEMAGKEICCGCYESDLSDAMTLIHCIDSERITYKLGRYNGINEDVCESLEDGDSILAFLPSWHSSDAWRGHYETKPGDDWIRVVDGWFGTVDGYTPYDEIDKFHKKWEVEQSTPRFEMIVCFPRTSNCCSCGIEIYVKDGWQQQFSNWLEGEKKDD